MSQAHEIDIRKHVRSYIMVLVALLTLTMITVAVSYLHLNVTAAVVVALFIASIKGSLVACYFMHLISERKLIYAVLAFTVFFFFGMLLLPLLGATDQVHI